MKKIETKYIVAGVIGLFTITGAVAYLQYSRLMNYEFKIKLNKIRTISTKLISFDVLINFMNKSSLTMKILSNISNIYINNSFVTKVSNNTPFEILPNSTSAIPINIQFKPADVLKAAKLNIIDITLSPEKINIRIDTVYTIKFWGFTKSLKDTTIFNLKELIEENKTTTNQQ